MLLVNIYIYIYIYILTSIAVFTSLINYKGVFIDGK